MKARSLRDVNNSASCPRLAAECGFKRFSMSASAPRDLGEPHPDHRMREENNRPLRSLFPAVSVRGHSCAPLQGAQLCTTPGRRECGSL
jgi:hypothetical protein